MMTLMSNLGNENTGNIPHIFPAYNEIILFILDSYNGERIKILFSRK